KHSNLVLVRADGVIVDSIKHINALKSRYREVLPGVRYLPPPSQNKQDPFHLTGDDLKPLADPGVGLGKWLAQTLDGVSPLIAREIAIGSGLDEQTPIERITPDQLGEIAAKCRRLVDLGQAGHAYWYYCKLDNRSEISAVPLAHLEHQEGYLGSLLPASDAVFRHFSLRETHLVFDQLQQRLSAVVDSALTKIRRKLSALREDWATTQRADEFRLWGELLKTHPQQAVKAAAVDVVNYYDSEMAMLTIALDPKLSVAQNAQAYFKRYAKAKAGQKLVEGQLAKAQEEANYLETVKAAIDTASEIEILKQILAELTEQGYIEAPRVSKQRKEIAPPPVGPKQLTIEGYTVLVGRNNQQNDELTMRMAASDDVWLHVKDIPGSHVVIRSDNPPEAVLLRAAQIAAYYSQARTSSNVPVDYTQRRHVRKPRGARPGFVIYDHQRTVYVHPREDDDLAPKS
ncbi:MAG: NFACT family protein, partial [Bacillota bacterium]